MTAKLFGAVLTLFACGGFGCSIAAGYRRQEAMLRSFLHTLRWMECELQYRLTPLPELCTLASRETTGALRMVLFRLGKTLEQQGGVDVPSCMELVLGEAGNLPVRIKRLLSQLGCGLGRFDLAGQIKGLHEIQTACQEALCALETGREQRLRSYQTLCLCAGVALVILFI